MSQQRKHSVVGCFIFLWKTLGFFPPCRSPTSAPGTAYFESAMHMPEDEFTLRVHLQPLLTARGHAVE